MVNMFGLLLDLRVQYFAMIAVDYSVIENLRPCLRAKLSQLDLS